jgi:hypothetical protein
MWFVFPFAFFGLVAVPALVAIYWLRNRSSRRTVSSLMLWMDQRQLKEGGLLIQRLQTPLLFFLEMLAVLLLVLACSGPLVRAGEGAHPLVIILDDSFSMLAGGDDSPRRRAEEAVRKELRTAGYSRIRLVLAGETPQMLGEISEDAQQLKSLLAQWTCFSPEADLGEAIAFAFAVEGEAARVLVLTDHQPSNPDEIDKLEWRAFGQRRNNIAIVNATRTARDGQDRCMIEVANISDEPAATDLILETAFADSNTFHELKHSRLELAPNASQRMVLTFAAGSGPVRARIAADALSVDNQAMLLPDNDRTVRVTINVRDQALRDIVENAVESVPIAAIVSNDAEVVLTDEREGAPDSRAWTIRFVASPDAQSYLGPFVMDKSHPLTEGVSLDGVVWGAARSAEAPRLPVIMAGNVPLVSEKRLADGAREVRFMFNPDLSTLQRTPAWPVLMWNIVSWRASELPGVDQCNLRLGSEAKIRLAPDATWLEVREPDGTTRQLSAVDGVANVRPRLPGLYDAAAGGKHYSFSVNPLRKEESDLRQMTSGTWSGTVSAAGADRNLRNIAWIFILLLLVVLAFHLALVARSSEAKQVTQ